MRSLKSISTNSISILSPLYSHESVLVSDTFLDDATNMLSDTFLDDATGIIYLILWKFIM
ncbi:MAG: hypothetical protein ACYDIA_22560 [Candidatus Humimicrobiaceae bacterium]